MLILNGFTSAAQTPTTAEGFLQAYQSAKQAAQSSPTYENLWKFARAAYDYATYGLAANLSEQRKAVYQEGKEAAERARRSNPRGVEGHYWYGVCLGSWAEVNGIMASLFAAGDLLAAATEAARLNPGYQNTAPLALRARVLHKAPGWPVSVGDRTQAEAELRRALTLGGDRNRTVFRFLGELLIDLGRKEEARTVLQRGAALPPDTEHPVADQRTLQEIRNLLSRL